MIACVVRQDLVGKLISPPGRYPNQRGYICKECIAVCATILENDRTEGSEPAPPRPPQLENPRLLHPLAPNLLAAAETWIRGQDLPVCPTLPSYSYSFDTIVALVLQ